MGSNMQRQAVPLIRPEAPIVGTGMEWQAAVDSGQVIVAKNDGEVVSVTGDTIVVLEKDGTRRVYHLRKYNRSNQSTCIDQRPVIFKGAQVETGAVLADSSSTDNGELGPGAERGRRLHVLGRRQLRRRHPGERAAGAG